MTEHDILSEGFDETIEERWGILDQISAPFKRTMFNERLRPIAQKGKSNCGQVALDMAYRCYGIYLGETNIARDMDIDEGGAKWEQMEKHAQGMEFKTHIFENMEYEELQFLQNLGYPLIVCWTSSYAHKGEGRYAVVREVKDNLIVLADPSLGDWQGVPKDEFVARWRDEEKQRAILMIAPDFEKERKLHGGKS